MPLKLTTLVTILFVVVPNVVYSQTRGVSEEEREALIAIYKITDGEHWKNRSGWLGPAGTECSWYGVQCGQEADGSPDVAILALPQNNLAGTIPEAATQLTHLGLLDLMGNRLPGLLPEGLVRRWLDGKLMIAAETPLLTDVSKIELDSNPSSLLCGRRTIILTSDDRILQFDTLCRNRTPRDRTTFCEMKDGKISSFPMLANLIVKNEFFSLPAEYGEGIVDAGISTIRVTRNGKAYQVEVDGAAAPLEFWDIEAAIAGIASNLDLLKTRTQSKCPSWN